MAASRRPGNLFVVSLVLVACGGRGDGDRDGSVAEGGGFLDGTDGGRDGGKADMPGPPSPYARPRYTRLSQTGLYEDLRTGAIRPGIEAFRPSFALWSDGAEKRRWVSLPPGTQIDARDPDRWVFPIGTRFWKEFSRNGLLLETRLVERYGEGPEDYWMGAFVWNAEGTDAELAEAGATDVRGTSHDVPSQKHCWACHNGEPGRALGFSLVQLGRADAGDGLLTVETLERAGRLNGAPVQKLFRPPGEEPTAAALGYLHANCGHCHNPRGTSWPDTQMDLRLTAADRTAGETAAWRTTVDQKLNYYRHPTLTRRVTPGDPDASALVERMALRGREQMPPLATETVDAWGLDLVRRWIAGLPR